jgi:hypothetical protein
VKHPGLFCGCLKNCQKFRGNIRTLLHLPSHEHRDVNEGIAQLVVRGADLYDTGEGRNPCIQTDCERKDSWISEAVVASGYVMSTSSKSLNAMTAPFYRQVEISAALITVTTPNPI